MPAVLYGTGVPATPLAVSAKEFEKVFRAAGETSLVTLNVEGGKPDSSEGTPLPGKAYNVLIHDVAKDPMTLALIHADFYAVRMDRPIEAKVPLAFVGEAPAVKNEGGILVKVLHELEVKALPTDLPHEIPVDISHLEKIGDKVHVADINLPNGVSTHAPAEEVVALVEPPRSEAELEELTKTEEAVPAEVKTERETKAEVKDAAAGEAEAAEE